MTEPAPHQYEPYRVVTDMEEPITIVCKHAMERVETDKGAGSRCSKCSLFFADEWFCPVPVLAECAQ